MASIDAVAEAIKFLSGANPAAFVRESTPTAYLEILADVTDEALREASRKYWGHFPGAHELRRAAVDLQTYEIPKRAVKPPEVDELRATAFELEQRGYAGHFVGVEWEVLAASFDRARRPDGAARLRSRAKALVAA